MQVPDRDGPVRGIGGVQRSEAHLGIVWERENARVQGVEEQPTPTAVAASTGVLREGAGCTIVQPLPGVYVYDRVQVHCFPTFAHTLHRMDCVAVVCVHM